MWISYTDSEVNKFHPICEIALNNALEKLGKTNEYKVLHHQYTSSLEMDFVIQNKNTGKYLCVIEVKRTPADVNSARYQFQAMSYVQMNSAENEKPFFILTNLERAFSFRYDSSRPRVFQQILKPGLYKIGNFQDNDRLEFIEKLSTFFKNQIESFINNEFDYLLTLDEFANHMEQIKNNSKKWKSHLAMLLYEYIRGSFNFINRNDLPDIRLFHNDIAKICNEAARVNFKDIFTYSNEKFENHSIIDNNILINLFDFGFQNVSGDSISNVLHQIVSAGHEHDGEVPTDLELGNIVSILAKHNVLNFSNNDIICDPAAGSGNLISTAINIFNLQPNQILVNDINSKLLELLSLRLGLNFARYVSVNNSPNINNEDIANLNFDFFEKVKIIVMNPPFVAGINCIERKNKLYAKLSEITNNNYITNFGQMPLEAVFLELISELVRPGTIIACVFPKTHLTARGPEAKIIRKLILTKFGLETIFTYPGDDIFTDITKDTCIIVGRSKSTTDYINVYSAYDNIPDIDTHRFTECLYYSLNDKFVSIMPGIIGKTISKEKLFITISDGWRELNSEMVQGINFVKKHFEKSNAFLTFKELNYRLKRGNAGNNGASDLLFINSKSNLYKIAIKENIVFVPAMRNAKYNSFLTKGGDSEFLDISENKEENILKLVKLYENTFKNYGRQTKKVKSTKELINILETESHHRFPKFSILIPRAIRKVGRIYLSNTQVFVSTNFVVCSPRNEKDAVLLSTWMSTIFYQLICEVASKDQEGMRKMEVGDIYETFVPKLDSIPEDLYNRLKVEIGTLEFLNLNNPKIRNIDIIWANYIFGDKASSILEEARRLLSFLANRRNP